MNRKPSTGTQTRALCLALILAALPSAGWGQVEVGIDTLASAAFAPLIGKRVGLITNHTGCSRSRRTTIDILHDTPACTLTALFCPEHGIRGTADERISSSTDPVTVLPIYSLYGKTTKPTAAMLNELDALVFDIQDIGARFYTYIGTMALAMQAAREHSVPFLVLDRPNPIGGIRVEGAVPRKELCGGLTCIYPIPTCHGMTVGELAQLFNEHFGIGCVLQVIPMRGWRREMGYEETGLAWIPTSPNMKSLEAARLYPGLGILEATTLSVGRGTDHPFLMYGAPYMDGDRVCSLLAGRSIPGLHFAPVEFVPSAKGHPFLGERCRGVQAFLDERDGLSPILTGLQLIQAIHETHPREFRALPAFHTLVGDSEVWQMLTETKTPPEEVIARWEPGLEEFKRIRARFLLY